MRQRSAALALSVVLAKLLRCPVSRPDFSTREAVLETANLSEMDSLHGPENSSSLEGSFVLTTDLLRPKCRVACIPLQAVTSFSQCSIVDHGPSRSCSAGEGSAKG